MAEAIIMLSADAFAAVCEGDAPKGDVLAAARIAGIMAAKKTPELIPLCHPIPLATVAIEFEMLVDTMRHPHRSHGKDGGQTGVEMEALTAATSGGADHLRHDQGRGQIRRHRINPSTDEIRRQERCVQGACAQSATIAAAKIRTCAGTWPRPPLHADGRSRGPAPPRPDASGQREAFRGFMVTHRLRATEWAKKAEVPAAQIYAFLTGRSRAIPPDMAERLARAANVRIEDMFR